jgi:hypothetical protein
MTSLREKRTGAPVSFIEPMKSIAADVGRDGWGRGSGL